MGEQTGKPCKKSMLMTAALIVSLHTSAWAAPVVERPDSGQALRNTQTNELRLPKEERPNVMVETPQAYLPSADSGMKVRLESIRITGQSVFAESDLASLYQDRLHTELTFGELRQIADRITKHFKEHGYLLAQAYLPEQAIEQGKVEIAVLVGRYGQIHLINNSQAADEAILRQLSALQSGALINNQDLERAVLLAGDLAGVSVKLTLEPGSSQGLADCTVEAVNKTGETQGSITINNWGNRFIGRIQSALSYQISNLGSAGDTLKLNLTGADDDLALTGLQYSLPIAEGLTLNTGYSKIRYWLGETYSYLDAHGTIYNKHADLTWALKRTRTANTNLQLGYDHKTLRDRIDYVGFTTDKSSHALSLGLSGDSRDTYAGGGVTLYALQWYDGSLRVQNGSTSQSSNWNKLTYTLLRQQTINKRLYLQTTLSGQQASTDLDSSERFSLGGASGVRAYPADEASGDEVWLVSGELHWTLPLQNPEQTLRLIGFYDKGVSHIEKKSSDPDNRRSLAGAGIGILWGAPGDYTLKASYAWKTGNTIARSDKDKNGRLWLQGTKYF